MKGVHIGISGWRYTPWRGGFYPEGLVQRRELEYASRAVTSIEINGSFYSLQTPERFASWRDATPDDFVFSVKAPRYITHVSRLRDIDEAMANFFASGPLQLAHQLGAFLWQFPPSMRYAPELFGALYLRLHGDKELYASGYDEQALSRWEERIRSWRSGRQPADARRISTKADSSRRGRDLYCYFDNDIKVRAPYDARRLLEKLGLADGLPVQPGQLPEEFQ